MVKSLFTLHYLLEDGHVSQVTEKWQHFDHTLNLATSHNAPRNDFLGFIFDMDILFGIGKVIVISKFKHRNFKILWQRWSQNLT